MIISAMSFPEDNVSYDSSSSSSYNVSMPLLIMYYMGHAGSIIDVCSRMSTQNHLFLALLPLINVYINCSPLQKEAFVVKLQSSFRLSVKYKYLLCSLDTFLFRLISVVSSARWPLTPLDSGFAQVYACVSVCEYMYVKVVPVEAKGVRSPEVGMINGCELPDVGETPGWESNLVLWKSNTCF